MSIELEGLEAENDPNVTQSTETTDQTSSLEPITINASLNDEGRALIAERKLRANYNSVDWITRQNAKKNHPDVYLRYLDLESRGIYPSPSSYEDHFDGFAEAYALGHQGWDENGTANFWMKATAYGGGGAVLATVGSAVFIEEAGSGLATNLYTRFIQAVHAENASTGISYGYYFRGGIAKLHVYGSSGFAAGNGTNLTASMYWTLNGLSRMGQVTSSTAATGQMLQYVPASLKWGISLTGAGIVPLSLYHDHLDKSTIEESDVESDDESIEERLEKINSYEYKQNGSISLTV